MESKTNKVTVTICGEEYVIKGQTDTEHIERVAALVHQKMTQTTLGNPRLPRNRAAVLVALNLADELLRLQADYKQFLKILKEEK
ncbi:MAG TPA: cell division protein ZapA [Firmicutes bacterium]|nr:cell division protein ZapA [Bacillota bacterium]